MRLRLLENIEKLLGYETRTEFSTIFIYFYSEKATLHPRKIRFSLIRVSANRINIRSLYSIRHQFVSLFYFCTATTRVTRSKPCYMEYLLPDLPSVWLVFRKTKLVVPRACSFFERQRLRGGRRPFCISGSLARAFSTRNGNAIFDGGGYVTDFDT